MRRKIWLKRLLYFFTVILFLGVAGIWYLTEYLLPYLPIKPARLELAASGRAQLQALGLHPEAFSVQTPDGIQLQALFLPANLSADSATTIIMVHGIGGCKEHFIPAAKRLIDAGFNVVLFDLRAHGESSGEYCTLGYQERGDISTLLDTVLQRHPHIKPGILGNSLGGAIALQTLAAEPRLQFGIIESTFHDMKSVSVEYGRDYFGFRSPWLAEYTLKKSSAIAHFPALDIQPFKSARQVHQPVFMAHGDADDKIPIAFGKINFESLASTRKQWYTVHGAGHFGLWETGGAAYWAAMIGFLRGK